GGSDDAATPCASPGREREVARHAKPTASKATRRHAPTIRRRREQDAWRRRRETNAAGGVTGNPATSRAESVDSERTGRGRSPATSSGGGLPRMTVGWSDGRNPASPPLVPPAGIGIPGPIAVGWSDGR